MARQNGIIHFSGSLGNMTGYNLNGKHYVKRKTNTFHLSAESIKSGYEFGRGSKAASLIRNAFMEMLLPAFSGSLYNRLAERLREVIRSGPESKKGKRNITDGNVQLLKGFELNAYTGFNKLVLMNQQIKLTAKTINIQLSEIGWGKQVIAPKNADCMVLKLACGFFDFKSSTYNISTSNGLRMKKDKNLRGAKLTIPVLKNKETVILLMPNVYFERNGNRIDDRRYQAGVFIDAIHLRDGKRVEFVNDENKIAKAVNTTKPKFDVEWSLNSGE